MVRVTWLFAAVLLACGPNVDVGDAGADDDDSSDGDTGTTTATTTAGTTVSTTLMTTTDTTTGTPQVCAGDEFVSGCQSYCAAVVTCDPSNGPYEDCVNGCIAELTPYTVECQNAFCDGYSCIGTLDCPTLENGIGDCAGLFSAASELCGSSGEVTSDAGGDTECFVGGDGGETCTLGCDADGVQRRFDCSNGTCTCFENQVEIASCGDGGICAIPDAIEDYANGCCGW